MRILPPAAMRDLETPRAGLPFARPVAAAARSIHPVDRALAIRTIEILSSSKVKRQSISRRPRFARHETHTIASFAPADTTGNWQK